MMKLAVKFACIAILHSCVATTALKASDYLTDLRLNGKTETTISKLREISSKSTYPYVTTIDIHCNDNFQEQDPTLADVLVGTLKSDRFPKLQYLSISGVLLKEHGGMALAESLKTFDKLKTLTIAGARMNATACQAILDNLTCASTLRDLILEENGLGNPGALALSRKMVEFTQLKALYLKSISGSTANVENTNYQWFVGKDAAKSLAESLHQNAPELTELYFIHCARDENIKPLTNEIKPFFDDANNIRKLNRLPEIKFYFQNHKG